MNLAVNDEDAQARYEQWRTIDPFPDIPSALLNSADLQDYVAVTGMIHPFTPGDDSLKPASYAIPLEGEVLFWEESFDESTGKRHQRERRLELKPGDHLRLKRNSIVYVTLAPVLRLPNYIAARFNLTILDIYRGLLVGTGPLVDPGFVGRIHLPLHNYTANDYDIVANEAMVWMEFTKLSPNPAWTKPVSESPERSASFAGFPPRKLERELISDYLKDHEPVVSSIPRLVADARESARVAADKARSVRNISFAAALGVVIGVAAIVVTIIIGLNGISDEQGKLRAEMERLKAAAHKTHHPSPSSSSDTISPSQSGGSTR
ncbi:MAG: dCTP deaminase domain-containing protein [Solirubrobacterales bacterium]